MERALSEHRAKRERVYRRLWSEEDCEGCYKPKVYAEEYDSNEKVLLPLRRPHNTEGYSDHEPYDVGYVAHISVEARYAAGVVDDDDVIDEIDDSDQALRHHEDPRELQRFHQHHARGRCEDGSGRT